MSSLSVHVQYRPIKIGFCIRENNLEDYKKALQLTHTLWGGKYNPLIPIGNDEYAARRIIAFFKPDVLYPITSDDALINFIKQFPHIPWPFELNKELFSGGALWDKQPNFLDIHNAARKLRDDAIKNNNIAKQLLTLIKWDAKDPLAPMFEAMFGSYPTQHEIDCNYDKLLSKLLPTNEITLDQNESIPSSILKVCTRNILTSYGLGELEYDNFESPYYYSSGFYVGEIDDFNDLVIFWNLRACGEHLLFYDNNFTSRLEQCKDSYVIETKKICEDCPELSITLGLWGSKNKINKIDKSIFGENIYVKNLSKYYNFRNYHFKPQIVLGNTFESESKTVSFSLPNNPVIDADITSRQHLMTTVKVLGDISDEKRIFNMPYMPQLNDFYGRNCYFIFDKVRSQHKGLGIITNASDNHMSLRAISVNKLIQAIFHQNGMDITPSEAGKKTTVIIKQLGGLFGCNIFKSKGIRELLRKYTPNKSFTKNDALKTIGENDFGKYSKLYSLNTSHGKRLQAIDVFKDLATKDVFRAGLTLKCENCHLNFWLSIDKIKSNIICEYCGANIRTINQIENNKWGYRVSGIFGNNDNQGGGISVVLTLLQLKRSCRSAYEQFLYIPSVNILPINAAVNKCESDFIIITCTYYGKISVVVSECKTNNEISIDDVKNLTKVADAFEKNGIESYILFSKLNSFSNDEIEICRNAQLSNRDRVIMLTDRELESRYIYSETKKTFEIKDSTNWDSLAKNTTAIFFEKKIKS